MPQPIQVLVRRDPKPQDSAAHSRARDQPRAPQKASCWGDLDPLGSFLPCPQGLAAGAGDALRAGRSSSIPVPLAWLQVCIMGQEDRGDLAVLGGLSNQGLLWDPWGRSVPQPRGSRGAPVFLEDQGVLLVLVPPLALEDPHLPWVPSVPWSQTAQSCP